MRSRNIVLTAFLSSLITGVLIMAVLFGVGTTFADNVFQEGNPPPPESAGGLPADPFELPEGPELISATTTYMHIAGSAFQPLSSSTTFGHTWYGCIYSSSDLIYNLDLPNNTVITGLYLYYKDYNAASNGRFSLYYFNDGPTGGDWLERLYTAGSSGSPGVDYVTGLNYTLNTPAYSYVLYWEPITGSSNIELCGANIAYQPVGFFGSALPIIVK